MIAHFIQTAVIAAGFGGLVILLLDGPPRDKRK